MLCGNLPIKPGSVGKAVCGYIIKIFNEGNEVQANQQGYVVVKLHYLQERCFLWKDNTRFRTGYLEQFPGYYFQVTEDIKMRMTIFISLEESMMLSMLQDIGFQRLRWKK
jgi:acyl-coenzyme A synthetase/AMP-(fatty) acid ligase